MKVRFWGVRGSLPTPLSPDQMRSKIAAVVERIRPADIVDARTREKFLAGLPAYIFGSAGGNTPCVEVRTSDDKLIILDAGTGLRDLGVSLEKRRDPVSEFLLLFSHFHWDHLQGIPFFGPAWVKGNTVTFASPFPSVERTIRDQMRPPYFPVTMDAMQAKLRFRYLQGEGLRVGNAAVRWKRMNHPGGSFAYKITDNGKSVIYATDSEVTDREFQQREENRAFFESADVLIIDSQYTLEESFTKFDFGHTSYTMAVNLAVEWKVKNLVLFHHEPRYDDRKVFGIARSARWHQQQLGTTALTVRTAWEGLEITP
jgi:phosphoribosyl 1,2-cyclic phosphodiesterase